jgi:membrane-bound serine protease (ClpP class)
MSIPGPLLAVLADPNVTYLLFVLGIIGLIAEFHHPGTLVPGIVGALGLLLALVGFGELGVDWISVALILLAAGLFIAEAHTSGFGLLALGGILAFVAGSWLLFVPLAPPAGLAAAPSGSRVSLWLIALGTLTLGGYVLLVVRAVLRMRHLPSVTGAEALLGQEGVATSDLAPRGTVRVGGEEWSAIAEGAEGVPISAGETVEVLAVDGVILHVHRPYEWTVPGGSSV